MKRVLLINGNQEVVDYKVCVNGDVQVSIDGHDFVFSGFGQSDRLRWLKVHGGFKTAFVSEDTLSIEGVDYKYFDSKVSKRTKGASTDGGGMLSPMPGKILKVMIKVGDAVKSGDSLIVMEAMKMEHTIKASEDGVIGAVHCSEGSLVDGGIALCSFQSEDS